MSVLKDKDVGASNVNGGEPTVVSHTELQRIRSLSANEFEAEFLAQLRNERKQVLLSGYFMKEAYRRRDWAKTHSEFKKYCVDVMKMSDSDFYRKYAIMKTLNELPEIEEKLLDGRLNQATLSKAIQFLNKEAKVEARVIPLEEKRELFSKIENLTEYQVERELAMICPEAAIPDRVKQISVNGYHREYTSDQDLEDKFKLLKEIFAHRFSGGNPSECDFLRVLADIALEKHDPVRKDERKDKREKAKATKQASLANKPQDGDKSLHLDLSDKIPKLVKHGVRKIERDRLTAPMKRVVRKKYNYRCGHVNKKTGEICGSSYAHQFDHIIPIALGGKTVIENLRLVCRTHNQQYAIEKLGRSKIGRFMKSLN